MFGIMVLALILAAVSLVAIILIAAAFYVLGCKDTIRKMERDFQERNQEREL